MVEEPAFLDHGRPVEERVGDLMSRMALEENVSQMMMPSPALLRLGISAYNAVDGMPCSANGFLLEKVLRGEWGFNGVVVGDVDSVNDVQAGHHFAKYTAESSAAALNAGNDL